MQSIAIFGGTFDPIHQGHIQASLAIQQAFHFDSYRFIPCKLPTLKSASIATAKQRIAMLELAITQYKQFEMDLREINRETPSYMIDTLESIRKENINASITLILGYDAFLSLTQWHCWEQLITVGNLLIINRALSNAELPITLQQLLNKHLTQNKEELLNQKMGVIYQFDAGAYPISSTKIRTALKNKMDVSQTISQEVYQYIKKYSLYT